MRLGLRIAVCLLALVPATAAADVLVQVRLDGQDVRLVVDRAKQRVLLSAGQVRTLVDLNAGLVYVQSADGLARRAHARFRPGYDQEAPYRVEPFGPGPMIAGNLSSYHVLFADQKVCAELMLNDWMKPFLDPAVRALALLEQLKGPPPADPCAAIPFATYAAAGWPLMAGKIDHPTFETTAVRFDYQPAPGELAPPERFEDVGIYELAKFVQAAGF